jgi:hypothetical protein
MSVALEKREFPMRALAVITSSSCLRPPPRAQVIDTRVGKLSFHNGYPAKSTAAALFDEMDF